MSDDHGAAALPATGQAVRPSSRHASAPLPHANVSERKLAPPAVAVSTVILGVGRQPSPRLLVPLVRRVRHPYLGQWALPGGPLQWNESLADAAKRTFVATTGFAPRYLEQLYTFGGLSRSPDLRLVSVVYWALVDGAVAAIDPSTPVAENVAWFPADDPPELAFDHARILAFAVRQLRTRMEVSQAAAGLIADTFTIAELREVHEAVLARPVDPGNFRRSVIASGTIVETADVDRSGAHRPARRYRFTAPPAPPSHVLAAEPELLTALEAP